MAACKCFSLFKYFKLTGSRAITKFKFLNLKKNKNLDSIFLITFQCILHYLAVLFSFSFPDFSEIIQAGLISLWKLFCKMTELFWVIPTFCNSVFQFEGLKLFVTDEISICLHDLEGFFTVFQNFHKFAKGELISWGEPTLHYLVIPFYILV